MRPDHVLFISLNFEPSHGPALAQAFKDLGFALETVGTQPRAYKRLEKFDPLTWEREAIMELEPVLLSQRCAIAAMFVEHQGGKRTDGVIIHSKTLKPSNL